VPTGGVTGLNRPDRSGFATRAQFVRAGVLLIVLWSSRINPVGAAERVSFRNDVMAVVSKAGCNAGMCHGNQNGKAGFKLSLRGEDSEFDYNALTRDAFGRRTNPFQPERSLMLLKATAEIAHEGGLRFQRGSAEYEIIRRWIAEGVPNDLTTAPKITALEATPQEQILFAPSRELQLRITGKFSDGSERDLTTKAVYESANPAATITHDGLVSMARPGESTILVRYLNRQVPVSLALVPERSNFKWSGPDEVNYVDKFVFRKLRQLRTNPSQVCNDEVFLRRISLDLLGILPTAEEARQFITDKRHDKRERLVAKALQRPEFADFWALKWSDLLRNEERVLDRKGSDAFYHWVRQSIAENKPIDQFVREIVSARGSTYENPAANFYRASRDSVTRGEATAQLFLGTRLQCAQCHNHPFDRWTQDDYFDWAGVFSRVQYKVLRNLRQDSNDQHEFKGEQVVFIASKGDVKNPRTHKAAYPRFLGSTGQDAGIEDDPLRSVAEWITSPRNKLFARSQANRIWFHLMGRGIVDPIDDFRATNPASHPELLDALATDFVEHKFNLRHLIEVIVNSRTYQLASDPNDTNREDESNFSHAIVRRLSAEQLLDCQSQVLATAVTFEGFPTGFRAAQIPSAHHERKRDKTAAASDQFLDVFGKPQRLLTCECERSSDTTMSQAFQLISGRSINGMLSSRDNRLTSLLASGFTNQKMVEQLYWTALSRAPQPAELAKALHLLEPSEDRRSALEDLAWALLNSKEFVLRR
jgi:hypothetical protein